jgi:mannose-1-phosphate guanylyltransferase
MLRCSVMLFAAGLGTRLKPFTETIPKPAIGLHNIPLGFYLFPYFLNIKMTKFVINTFHLPQQIKQLYGNTEKIFHVSPQFSDETGEIKESAGGLKQAEIFFDKKDPILVCNSDEVLFTEQTNFISDLIYFHQHEKNFASLVVIEHSEAGNKFGAIWTDDNNRVIDIGKNRPSRSAKAWHFIGVQLLDSSIFDLIEEEKKLNIFYDLLINHLKDRKVKVYPIQADWYETGNISDYKDAKLLIADQLKLNKFYKNQMNILKQMTSTLNIQVSDLA